LTSVNRYNLRSKAADQSCEDQMQNRDRKPVIEFAVMTHNLYRLEIGKDY